MREKIGRMINRMRGIKSSEKIHIGDKVKLKKEELNAFPRWVREMIGGALIVREIRGNIIGAFVPRSKNGIHRHKKHFTKI